jgi:hypothetical protein
LKITTYASIITEDNPNFVDLYRIVHSELFDEVSSKAAICEGLRISVRNAEVLDTRFVDDYELMLLLKNDGTSPHPTLKYYLIPVEQIHHTSFLSHTEQRPKTILVLHSKPLIYHHLFYPMGSDQKFNQHGRYQALRIWAHIYGKNSHQIHKDLIPFVLKLMAASIDVAA